MTLVLVRKKPEPAYKTPWRVASTKVRIFLELFVEVSRLFCVKKKKI